MDDQSKDQLKLKSDLWTLGVDLGGTHLRVAGIDPEGKIYHLQVESSRCSNSELRTQMIQLIQRVQGHLPEISWRGIGISTGGVIQDNQIVSATESIDNWVATPLAQELTEHFQLPVWLENDGNCALLAECRYGVGNSENLMVVTLGTGVGIGIQLAGQLLPYAEIYRHVESKFSGKRFEESPESLWEEIPTLVHYLGVVIEILAPEQLVMAGPIAQVTGWWEEFSRQLRENLTPFHQKRLQLVCSSLTQTGLLGASTLPRR